MIHDHLKFRIILLCARDAIRSKSCQLQSRCKALRVEAAPRDNLFLVQGLVDPALRVWDTSIPFAICWFPNLFLNIGGYSKWLSKYLSRLRHQFRRPRQHWHQVRMLTWVLTDVVYFAGKTKTGIRAFSSNNGRTNHPVTGVISVELWPRGNNKTFYQWRLFNVKWPFLMSASFKVRPNRCVRNCLGNQ